MDNYNGQQSNIKKAVQYDVASLEEIIQQERNRVVHYRPPLFRRQVRIEQSVEEEKGRIQNEGLRQNLILKKATLRALFIFLAAETVIIFIFSFFQATEIPLGFHLEEWSFKLLVGVTILQITYMLQVAVKHLFPENKN